MLRHHISQSTIARETGGAISQSYISQWLSTNGQEISDAKKRSLYVWFIVVKNKVNSGTKVAQPAVPNGHVDDQKESIELPKMNDVPSKMPSVNAEITASFDRLTILSF